MKLGLKISADSQALDRLNDANPPFVEVWFNICDANRYNDLFDELARRRCEVGLHFWGLLDGNIAPNIAYPKTDVIDASIALMRQTIDIASKRHFSYVNIHPGASALSKVDYEAERFDLVSSPVDSDSSTHIFLEHANELSNYADSRGIVFTVETVPARVTNGWYNVHARQTAKNIYELPDTAVVRAAFDGLWVANDFCHTAANVISDNPNSVWKHLNTVTQQLASKTRLIHLGFVMPPFNGTDNHDMLDNPILDTGLAVPNKKQMRDLLKLFQHRDDVWILAEPKEDHVKNYFLVRELLEKSEKEI